MAGHRKKNSGPVWPGMRRQPRPVQKLTQAEARSSRQAEFFCQRFEDAATPSQQIGVSAGYMQAVMKRADPHLAARAAQRVQDVIDAETQRLRMAESEHRLVLRSR